MAKSDPFYMEKFTVVKVGTIAVFGVNNTDVIESIAKNLVKLGNFYGQLVISRMGEEVPAPDTLDVVQVEDRKPYARLSYQERLIIDKCFCIFYLESDGPGIDGTFAYVNIRGDRISALLRRGMEDESFNIIDYATIVLTGTGQPTFEDREKLQRDYLFGERHVNVRIFPPLDQVT